MSPAVGWQIRPSAISLGCRPHRSRGLPTRHGRRGTAFRATGTCRLPSPPPPPPSTPRVATPLEPDPDEGHPRFDALSEYRCRRPGRLPVVPAAAVAGDAPSSASVGALLVAPPLTAGLGPARRAGCPALALARPSRRRLASSIGLPRRPRRRRRTPRPQLSPPRGRWAAAPAAEVDEPVITPAPERTRRPRPAEAAAPDPAEAAVVDPAEAVTPDRAEIAAPDPALPDEGPRLRRPARPATEAATRRALAARSPVGRRRPSPLVQSDVGVSKINYSTPLATNALSCISGASAKRVRAAALGDRRTRTHVQGRGLPR